MPIPPGTKLGRYKIVSALGAGGMGEVYLAHDMRLGRQIALKILPHEFAEDANRLRRFKQEATAASGLNHPNILTIHEIGETDDAHYIATEFVDGETLRGRMARGRMNLSEILEVAVQMASALAAAHAAGIVHRDIKPENIMLRPDGYVKVLDFGLAKLTERQSLTAHAEDSTRVLINTDAGVVMGTAFYLSPEQARGIPVDARTDLWSLGCVLYEMVTGRMPFEGATTSHVIVSILEKEPPPFARYREVPDELERIVTKALSKNREERYQTAKDLELDLKRLKQRLDVEAEIERTAPPEMSREATASTSGAQSTITTHQQGAAQSTPDVMSNAGNTLSRTKHRKLWLTSVAAVLIISAALFTYLYFARSGKVTIDSIAVMPLTNVGADPNMEYLSDGITESLINSLSQLPGLAVISRSSVFRYKGREIDPQAVGHELGVRAVLTGRVVQLGDNLSISVELVDASNNHQLWGEKYNRKLSDLLAVQSEISREISDKLRSKLTGEEEKRVTRRYTENPEAYQLYLQGRFYWNKRSEEGFRKAIGYFNQAIEKDPGYALAYAGLANCYISLDAYALVPPREAVPKAQAAAKKALEIDDTLAEAHTALATYYYDWDWAAAEKQFRRAIELNPNYATAHQWYGEFLAYQGRFDEALAETRRALELDPLSIIISSVVGSILYHAGRYDESIEQSRKTIEMDSSFARAHRYLGQAYQMKGMHTEALEEIQKAVALSGNTTEYRAVLGWAYALAGKRAEALKIIEELKEQSKQRYVPPYNVALIYAGLGEKDQAFEWLEKAYEVRDYGLIGLKVSLAPDSLRSDPRFRDLMQRIGLIP